MSSSNQNSTIQQVLDHLYQYPDVLISGAEKPFPIQVILADKKKRYTEFYRVRAECSQNNKPYYWIRIVKNKPTDVIHQAIEKQYDIMLRLFSYFTTLGISDGKRFSCCRPIALFKEHRAVITQECSGILFNRYLQRQLPILNQKQILGHCYNCGAWLNHFHECFRQNIEGAAFDDFMERFNKRFGRYPDKNMRFITYCHNDYSPRNIFAGEKLLEVIDFVGVENGFPEEDLDFFCNYVQKAKFNLLYPRQFKEKMVFEFIKGYKNTNLK